MSSIDHNRAVENEIDEGAESQAFVPIYTSEDEHDLVLDEERNRGITKQPVNEKKHASPSSRSSSDRESLEFPAKKAKLAATASLVSYAIDEEEDEDQATPSDNESSGLFLSGSVIKHVHPELVQYGLHAESMMNTSHEESGGLIFDHQNEPPKIMCADYQPQAGQQSLQDELHTDPPANELPNSTADLTTNSNEQTDRSQIMLLLESVQLPTEPTGHCSMKLQEKVDREVRRMLYGIGQDPNHAIQDNKAFRNPSIYEKLISFLNIDEKGTNFPTDIYNPYRWSPQSYYEELGQIQDREMEHQAKLKKEQKKETGSTETVKSLNAVSMTKASSQPVLATMAGFAEPKKRSKWDSEVPTNAPSEDDTKSITESSVGSLVKQV